MLKRELSVNVLLSTFTERKRRILVVASVIDGSKHTSDIKFPGRKNPDPRWPRVLPTSPLANSLSLCENTWFFGLLPVWGCQEKLFPAPSSPDSRGKPCRDPGSCDAAKEPIHQSSFPQNYAKTERISPLGSILHKPLYLFHQNPKRTVRIPVKAFPSREVLPY